MPTASTGIKALSSGVTLHVIAHFCRQLRCCAKRRRRIVSPSTAAVVPAAILRSRFAVDRDLATRLAAAAGAADVE
jgi:hypothetical protein